MRRESSLYDHEVVVQVIQYLRELLRKLLLKETCQCLQFWEIMRVALTPVTLLHELQQRPEDFLFVLDVEQEYANNIIHPLHVIHLIIVVAVGFQHIEKFVVPSVVILFPQD